MASESGKFKKGDWVRATENWLSVEVGDLCKVARFEDDSGYWVQRHGAGSADFYMASHEIEPWTPAVGARVRVTGNPTWAGVGEVYDLVGGVVYVKMLDGRRKGEQGGFPLREVEPVVGGDAPAKFKVGDRVVSKTVKEAGVGVIEEVIGGGDYLVNYKDSWYRKCTDNERDIELVASAPSNDNTKPAGTIIKTKQGYGFKIARHGDYAWVDIGKKAPVTLRVEDITAA